MTEQIDFVNAPPHYRTDAGIEAIEVIERYGLVHSIHLGNAFKYLVRAHRKGDFVEDCGKALWYLRRFKKWHVCAADAVWPAAEDVEAAERWADPETIVQAFGLPGCLESAVAGLLSICLYDGDEDIVLDNIILDVEQAIAEASV